jgi:hypothetical protein
MKTVWISLLRNQKYNFVVQVSRNNLAKTSQTKKEMKDKIILFLSQ